MTEQLPNIAIANSDLMRAISAASYASLSDLAAAADTAVSHINRKLTAMIEDGLAEKTGPASWNLALTAKGERALLALSVFDGSVAIGQGGDPGQTLVEASLIDANPFNPRITVDPIADAEMARSVADKGILQRILVRPIAGGRYQQALGHRRVRGALKAGVLVPIEIRELSDDDMAEIGVIENVQRADLHWLDEAEGYLMLSARGKSAAQIQALVGTGGRKKRSIQEMIQFARELPDEAKALARLPDADPIRLSIEQARTLVGKKKAKPALDLPPKAGVAFLELLLAGDCAMGEVGDVIEAVLSATPARGGAIASLQDRELVKLKVKSGQPVALVEITEVVALYMKEAGYDDDPVAAVNAARTAVLGELLAGALAVDGRYMTAELNPPDEVEERRPARPTPIEVASNPFLSDAAEVAETPVAVVLPEVSEDGALTLLELTHKALTEPNRLQGEPEATEVDASYRSDPVQGQLVFDRLIFFQVRGPKVFAGLTALGQAWLDSRHIARDAAGRPVLDDTALAYTQAVAGRPLRGDYVTPWLSIKGPETAAAAQAEPSADLEDEDPEAHAVRGDGAPSRDGFMQAVLETVAEPTEPAPPLEPSTLTRLMAAAREARLLINSGKSRKLKPDEVDTVLALVDAALGDAESALEIRGLSSEYGAGQ